MITSLSWVVFICQPTGLLWLLFCGLSCANIHHFFKYLPLFVLRLHWPDDLATDHLPPDICHPEQTEVAATGIFQAFCSENSDKHAEKTYSKLHQLLPQYNFFSFWSLFTLFYPRIRIYTIKSVLLGLLATVESYQQKAMTCLDDKLVHRLFDQ